MKTVKRAAAVLTAALTLLLGFPVSSVGALKTDAQTPGRPAFAAAETACADTALPEEAPPEEAGAGAGAVSGRRTVSLPASTRRASLPAYGDADAAVDWDGVLEAVWEALYTEKTRVDITRFGVANNDSNTGYLYWNAMFNPRFLRIRFKLEVSDRLVTAIVYDGDWQANLQKYNACIRAMDTLLYGVLGNETLSDAEKCLLLHDRLAVWSAYDYENYLLGTVPEDSYSAYGPLGLRQGVCNGIALAYGWMLDILGIENAYVSSESLNHGWTRVVLDGEPYYVDVTFDDPATDVPGRVRHDNFLLSFSAFSATHSGATDFDPSPVSTLYEDHFSHSAASEIVLIGNAFYFFREAPSDTRKSELVRRDVSTGEETVLITTDRYYWVGYTGHPAPPLLTAVGSVLLYTAGREVRAYDTAAGTDASVFTPSEALFPAADFRLLGIRQSEGRVYVTAFNNPNFDLHTVAGYTEAFDFCAHENSAVLRLEKGENCLTRGVKATICPDCGKTAYIPGEGALGDHSFTAQTVGEAALSREATCSSPAAYNYSCAMCGAVDTESGRTFTYGDPLPHTYTVFSVDEATPSCPGFTTYECTVCGWQTETDFTYCPGSLASGAIGDLFAWQIYNGLLSVYGFGDMPVFSADSPAPWKAYADEITGIYVNDVTSVGDYAFYGLTGAAALRLPDELTSIGSYAFYNALSLPELICPPSLLSVGEHAFDHAERLAYVRFDQGLKTIGAYAFANAYALTDITIPGSVGSLGFLSFGYCRSVKTVVIEEGALESLPSFYFSGSPGVYGPDEISLPSTVVYISPITVFNSLSAAKRITVAPENPSYATLDGVLYSKDMTVLLKYPALKPDVCFEAPASVTGLGERAFYAAAKLEYLDLSGTGVTTIDANTPFVNMAALKYLNLPDGLRSVPAAAFSGTNLEKLYVPSAVTAVSDTFITPPFGTVYTDSETAAAAAVCKANGIACITLPGHVHAYTETAYDAPGTCTVPGLTIRVCLCGRFECVRATRPHDFAAADIKEEALASPASCTAPASYYYSCVQCGAVERDGAHTFFYGNALQHSFTDPAVKPEALYAGATCQTAALYFYSCAVCGVPAGDSSLVFSYGAPTGHNWIVMVDVPATCVREGLAHEVCTQCASVRNENTVLPATGVHTWEWVVDTAPTCVSPGVRHQECTGCGAKQSEGAEAPATGVHSYTKAIVKDEALKAGATCLVRAEYYYSCAACGAVEQNAAHTFFSGDLGGHSWEWVTDTEPTCVSRGTQHEECAVCHAKRNEDAPVPATGVHSWEWVTDTEPTCGAPGAKHEECAVCHAKQNENTAVPPTGLHSWEWVTDTEPTCGAPGAKHGECAVCHAKQNENTAIPPTGLHRWDEGREVVSPTCAQDGVRVYTCEVCRREESQPVPCTGHTDANGDGVCDVCGAAVIPPETCGFCGRTHTGPLGWIVAFLHSLAESFRKSAAGGR